MQCDVEVLVWTSLFIDILPKEIKTSWPQQIQSNPVSTEHPALCHFKFFLLWLPLLDALCDCLFYTEAYANSIVLWWYFNVITYVKALNPKPTRCTSSCALCTSDKVILLQSTKCTTICLNEPNSITVYTAFLVKAFLHLFVYCVLICLCCS